MKELFGIIAIILTIVGYIPYIKSVIAKQTKPHAFSWGIWTLDAFIIFALQYGSGAGSGAFMTLTVAILCLLVLILSIHHNKKPDITKSDKLFAALALAALVIWLFAKQPLISALLIILVDLLGFVPTVRKSWKNPHSEIPIFYMLNVIRFACAIIALEQYSIITLSYPAVWLPINGLFWWMIISRQKLVSP